MLSEREIGVAERYATGQTYRQIAAELNIAPATVRNHLAAIYRKLGIGNKAKLISLMSVKTGSDNISGLPDSCSLTAPVIRMLDESVLPPVSGPSIAVMPFRNIGAAENDYFCHGVTVNIHNDLTRFRDLFVSGRSSCLAIYKLTNDELEISKRLGVHYVVRGSVRSDGNSVRITVQLVDGTSAEVLWSEQYERALKDVFEVEAEIASTIAGALSVRIEDVQYGRRKQVPSEWLPAYELQLRGNRCLESGGAENFKQARREFIRALELEPESAVAYAGLSMSYGYECDQLFAVDYSESLDRHLEFAEKAVSLDESDSRAHYAMVCALALSDQFELADIHAVRALELNPNEYHNLCNRGYTLMSLGRIGESVACFNESLRRNPLAPNSCLLALGLIEYLEKNYAQSVFAISRLPGNYLQRGSSLAAAYSQLGYEDKASSAARKFKRVVEDRPAYPSGYDTAVWRKFWRRVYPYLKREMFQHMVEGISKAGLPV